jgi:hypothetical protein
MPLLQIMGRIRGSGSSSGRGSTQPSTTRDDDDYNRMMYYRDRGR